jgi:Fe-S-cluster containining protein
MKCTDRCAGEHRTDAELLCQSCGLCCDGSLFGRARLEPAEVETARSKRLRVLDDGRGFEQPCPALVAILAGGRRTCSIYDERPLACRSFKCRLYDRHRREGGPIESRLAAVRRVRELVASLEASGLTPADFDVERSAGFGSPGVLAEQMFAELKLRLEEDFARA